MSTHRPRPERAVSSLAEGGREQGASSGVAGRWDGMTRLAFDSSTVAPNSRLGPAGHLPSVHGRIPASSRPFLYAASFGPSVLSREPGLPAFNWRALFSRRTSTVSPTCRTSDLCSVLQPRPTASVEWQYRDIDSHSAPKALQGTTLQGFNVHLSTYESDAHGHHRT